MGRSRSRSPRRGSRSPPRRERRDRSRSPRDSYRRDDRRDEKDRHYNEQRNSYNNRNDDRFAIGSVVIIIIAEISNTREEMKEGTIEEMNQGMLNQNY